MNGNDITQAQEDICRLLAVPPRLIGLKPSVRRRLWLNARVDRVAMWLSDHGHEGAAIRLWRIFRMW